MELVLEVNIPCDTEGIFVKAVVEQILHKGPLGCAIRPLVKSCVRTVCSDKQALDVKTLPSAFADVRSHLRCL